MGIEQFVTEKKENESTVNYVIRIVCDAIKSGVYKEGEKFPCESDLIKLLGVSRGSLREAVKMLVALGLLVVKQGDGTYIADRYTMPIIDPLTLNLSKVSWTAQELSDFRQKIETAVVELIIQNATDEKIKTLQDINIQMKVKIDEKAHFKEICELDVLFHKQMAVCTENSLFEILYKVCLDFISMQIYNLYASNSMMGYISYLLHQLMIENMLKRDVIATKEILFEAMKNHTDPDTRHLNILQYPHN